MEPLLSSEFEKLKDFIYNLKIVASTNLTNKDSNSKATDAHSYIKSIASQIDISDTDRSSYPTLLQFPLNSNGTPIETGIALHFVHARATHLQDQNDSIEYRRAIEALTDKSKLPRSYSKVMAEIEKEKERQKTVEAILKGEILV